MGRNVDLEIKITTIDKKPVSFLDYIYDLLNVEGGLRENEE